MKEKIKRILIIAGILFLTIIGIIWWNQYQENAKWVGICKTWCLYDRNEDVWFYCYRGECPVAPKIQRAFPTQEQCLDFCLQLK